MICIEDYSHLIPSHAGKVVGVASYRGEWLIVACEYGLYRVWDDGYGQLRQSAAPESERGILTTPDEPPRG